MSTITRGFLDLVGMILFLTRPMSEYVLTFIYNVVMGKHKTLPPVDNKILLMSATEIADKIRKRQLRSEEVVRAYVGRSRAVHSYINAAVDDRYDAAIREAKEVDIFLDFTSKSENDLARDTPLLGVPFSCKETIGVKGLAQTDGLVREKDHVATEDSDAAALYKKAGAIPYVVSNVPELCMWWESTNNVFGRTTNPYDSTRSPGGSSGGEGAIIGAAASVIGIGNDVGGSIRFPSSFCGIYGHKPSRGVVSNKGMYVENCDAWYDMGCTGPMCRYAEDLPLLTRLLADKDKKVKWNEKVDFKKVKVYYMEEIPGFFNQSDPDIKNAIRKAASHFLNVHETQVIRAKLPEMKHAFQIWECCMLQMRGDITMTKGLRPDGKICLYKELLKNLLRCSDHTLPALVFGLIELNHKGKYFKDGLKKFRRLEKKLEELLEGDAILLLPTQPEPPPLYLTTLPKFRNMGYTGVFNALGLPSSQVPAGLSNGLPIGIQVVSNLYQDHLTIAAAVELDKVYGGWRSPCPVTT